jgi:selenide,water dikinase
MDTRIRFTRPPSSDGSAADRDLARPAQHVPGDAETPSEHPFGTAEGERTTVIHRDTGPALVQALDFFPPIVDDPFVYGEIAAAQAMGRIYALGGEVISGLGIAAWPEGLSLDLLRAILAGSAAKMTEGEARIGGGQTIIAASPQYGLSLVGTIDPAHALTAGGAQPGDRLYLTKALGTGVILTAARCAATATEHLAEALASMRRLDRAAAAIARRDGVTACIGIAGRGLLGHAAQLATRSGCGVQLALSAVPFLSGALEYAELGFIPALTARNRLEHATYTTRHAAGAASVPVPRRSVDDLLHDPQTSGGLLLSIPAARTSAMQAAFSRARLALWPIGEVVAGAGVRVMP